MELLEKKRRRARRARTTVTKVPTRNLTPNPVTTRKVRTTILNVMAKHNIVKLSTQVGSAVKTIPVKNTIRAVLTGTSNVLRLPAMAVEEVMNVVKNIATKASLSTGRQIVVEIPTARRNTMGGTKSMSIYQIVCLCTNERAVNMKESMDRERRGLMTKMNIRNITRRKRSTRSTVVKTRILGMNLTNAVQANIEERAEVQNGTQAAITKRAVATVVVVDTAARNALSTGKTRTHLAVTSKARATEVTLIALVEAAADKSHQAMEETLIAVAVVTKEGTDARKARAMIVKKVLDMEAMALAVAMAGLKNVQTTVDVKSSLSMRAVDGMRMNMVSVGSSMAAAAAATADPVEGMVETKGTVAGINHAD